MLLFCRYTEYIECDFKLSFSCDWVNWDCILPSWKLQAKVMFIMLGLLTFSSKMKDSHFAKVILLVVTACKVKSGAG